jgi:hypothetical protein
LSPSKSIHSEQALSDHSTAPAHRHSTPIPPAYLSVPYGRHLCQFFQSLQGSYFLSLLQQYPLEHDRNQASDRYRLATFSSALVCA